MKFKQEIEQISNILNTPETYFKYPDCPVNTETNIGHIGYDKTTAGYRLFVVRSTKGGIDYIGIRKQESMFKIMLNEHIKQNCELLKQKLNNMGII